MSLATRSLGIASWTRLLPAAVIAMGMVGTAAADAPMSPEGIWYTKDQESIIRVHACTEGGGLYCGTLVWLKEPTEADGSAKLDKLNPDAAKKSRPIVGTDILLHMKADSDHWKGNAYNPEDGKLYDITFKVKGDDAADLRGCVLGFLCRTEAFTRASDVPGGDPTLADAGKKRKQTATNKKDPKAPAHK